LDAETPAAVPLAALVTLKGGVPRRWPIKSFELVIALC
jgi:hypothetical protein